MKQDDREPSAGGGGVGLARQSSVASGSASASDDCIKVAVRIRPLINSEIERGCRVILSKTPNSSQVSVNNDQRFTYNYAFDMDESQEMVYSNAVRPLVANLFRGLNVTILAYGQTGSGKTHTMGTNFDGDAQREAESGLIPRAIEQIFQHIEANGADHEYSVTCSFIELYQEQLYDLLSLRERDQSVVDIREDGSRGIFIANLSEIPALCAGDAIDCLMKGSAGRAVGATAMNATSSRSHAIYTVNVRQTPVANREQATSAKFHLVDLAGSERSNKTKATGQRLKEGIKINQGLLALGNVISALGNVGQSSNGGGGGGGGGKTHISYRDSKLTRLLQDSLGGNSVTLMIACVSPADYNAEETLSTLRYADRAKQIRNKPVVNQDPKMAEILRLRGIIDKLRLELMYRDNPEQPAPPGGWLTRCASDERPPDEDGSPGMPPPNSSQSAVQRNEADNTFVVGSPRRPAFRRLSGMPSAEELQRLRTENARLKQDYAAQHKILDRNLVNLSRVNLHYCSLEIRCDHLTTQLKSIRTQVTELCDALKAADTETQFQEGVTKALALQAVVEQAISAPWDSVSLDEMYATPADCGGEEPVWTVERDDQVRSNDQLMDLQRQIVLKTAITARVAQNQEQYAEMCGLSAMVDHSSRLAQLETELAEAQRAADDMKKAGRSANVNAKLAEERRKKVQELEADVRELKQKMEKQARMLRQQEVYKQQAVKAEQDLMRLKKARVALMRQVKETTDNANKKQSEERREHMAAEAKSRKESAKVKALNAKAERECVVMKRKVENCMAANKRLKEAMEKHKTAQAKRRRHGAAGGAQTAHREDQIQAWIDHEIEIIYSVVDAKHSLQQLIDDRADINRRLIEMRRGGANGVDEKQRELFAQLEEEVEMRNVQIADMQDKIQTSDLDDKIKQITDGLNSMPESRAAIRYLFSSLTDLRVEYDAKATRLQDMRTECEELGEKRSAERIAVQRQLRELREQCVEMRTARDELQRSYEEKVTLLLYELNKREIVHQATTAASATDADATAISTASSVHQRIQDELLDTMHAKIEAYEAQIAQLEKVAAAAAAAAGKRPSTRRSKPLKSDSADEQQDVDDDDDDEYEWETSSWHSDDPDRDPDWHKTPAAKDKQRNRKRAVLRESDANVTGGSQSAANVSANSNTTTTTTTAASTTITMSTHKCSCKGPCRKMCGCRRMGLACGDSCRCDRERCENSTAIEALASAAGVVDGTKLDKANESAALGVENAAGFLTPQRSTLNETTTPYPYENKKIKPLLKF